MHRTLMCSIVLTLIACAKKESGPRAAAGSGSSGAVTGSGSAQPPASSSSETAPPAPSSAGSATTDGADEVARLVVRAVGSKALGNQTIDAACVSVAIVPAGDWTVAAAWLEDCGDKTARSILWVYKRKTGPWNEDYAGQPPKCWKGIPPDIARAVTIATKIPSC